MDNQMSAADAVAVEEYLELKSKVTKTGIKMIIGFIIGAVWGLSSNDGSVVAVVIFGILCCGIPAAYTWIPFIALNLWTWFIKIVIAIFGGMLLSPFMIIYEIIQIIRLSRKKKELSL